MAAPVWNPANSDDWNIANIASQSATVAGNTVLTTSGWSTNVNDEYILVSGTAPLFVNLVTSGAVPGKTWVVKDVGSSNMGFAGIVVSGYPSASIDGISSGISLTSGWGVPGGATTQAGKTFITKGFLFDGIGIWTIK